ncbi:MAG: hypothetical protein CMQ05_05290 [Gammaproteobacteria bacterium]|nr:hypothetical protein [Gammaproteobacteria bacterium]RPG25828.1 MAG: ABC transporter ATP-binding protein [Gammaproteobacteria bacterium TMED50]
MKSLLRLFPYFYTYRYWVLLGFGGFFFSRLFEIFTSYFIAMGIDEIALQLQGEQGPYSVAAIALISMACVVGRFVFVIYARRIIRRAGIAVSYDLRQAVYGAVQHQSSEFFSRIGVGDIMTRAIQDIALIQRLIGNGSVHLVIIVYAPLFAITFMSYKSPSLTLLILPILPILFGYAWWISREMAATSKVVQERLSALSAHVQENLSGIRTVQAMAQEENEIARFWQTNDAYGNAFYRQARVQSLMSAWMPFFAAIAQLVILVYGGNLVLDGEMTVGDLVFFLFCLNMLLQPIRMAGMFITLVQRAVVASRRLGEILEAEPEITDAPTRKTPDIITGAFELRDLSFTYSGARTPSLRSLNLSIEHGESIGIVGRVGAGKSTLLKLFTRMVDTPRGSLFVDGSDVCDYPLNQLRAQIAQVLQDPFLFGEPLRSNISYDEPGRRLDQVWSSADAAALRDTIELFPAQMETVVGERGVTLSGGQKQRTTLARGLIREAPVLILDDCFSSVDTETEEHILGRLKQMRGDRTTILVSHRVSTLRHCDRIVVLDEGEIAELGSHEELLRADGMYAELERVQTQSGDRTQLDGDAADAELHPA